MRNQFEFKKNEMLFNFICKLLIFQFDLIHSKNDD